MACMDILSDDEDVPMAPAASSVTVPPPPAPEAPAPAPMLTGDVDLLDSDDEPPVATPAVAANPEQPKEAPTQQGKQEDQPTEDQKEQARPGLRSVVIGSMDLVDSDDEGALVGGSVVPPASAPAAQPKVAAPAQIQAVPATPAKAQADSEEEDEDLVTSLGGAAASVPSAGPTASAVAEDSEDEVIGTAKATETTPAAKRPPPDELGSPEGPAAKAPKKVDKPDTKKEAKPKAGAKAEPKDKKLSKDEMESRVLEYMQQQNRPYNAQNVFDNLHGVVPKGQVQLILDKLAASKQLASKEYGKFKYFLAAQADMAPEAVEEEARQLSTEIETVEAHLREVKSSHDEKKRVASAWRSRQNSESEAASLGEEAKALEKRLADLREAAEAKDGAVAQVDEAEIKSVEQNLRGAVGHWKKRKRLCMEVLKTFSEGSGMKLSALVDRYGIDTDEACDQRMPEV